ncbi:hypothetical protein Vadar_006690 [Vaccinium darrowii]|uniref:Uncharacterized protein n=1 Tax=Vaccinium darrowii TaxID=229202 RepID=A0ACB7Z235_9ERIC|nr:hypothetical protein Vadar_006690 [Vaccinium darrowii]
MGRKNQCCAIFVLINSLLLASLQLINAQIVGEYSVTNLSTSWHDIPTLYSSDGTFMIKPILARTTPSVGFFSGFSCNDFIRYCLFSVVISPGPNTLQSSRINEPRLVWSANRNNPVRVNATLRFTENGDLILAEDDGSLVWSTNTGGKSVSGLNLTEEGNLVLFDRNNTMVWQSFDHPTDSLLLGQNLALGRKLIASVSTSNWSQGTFMLDAQRDGLYAYLDSDPPMHYYESTNNLRFENGSFNGLSIPFASSPAQFMKLEPDGHLMVYQWVETNDTNWTATDLSTPIIGVCGYPMACGKYGVCSNGQCSCPPGEAKTGTSFFRQENSRQPNQGCSLITPISCNNSQYHSLLELQNASYFSFHQIVYEEKELEDCKKTCLNNCSCKAVIVQSEGNQNACLLLSEVHTLINQEGGEFSNYSAFLKVQSYPTAVVAGLVPYTQESRPVVAVISGIGAFFALAAMLVAFLIFLYGKDKKSNELDEIHLNLVPGMLTRFSYEDLKAATNDFTIKLGQGGKNLDRSQPEEDMHLLALFKRKAEEGRLRDIIDKHHDEMQLQEAEVIEMMRIAAWCLQSDSARRPPMSVVVKVLEGLVDVETNLDYSFTNLPITRKVGAARLNEDEVRPATMLFPSTLSGRR